MWHKVKTTFSAVQFFSAPLQNQGAAKNIGPKPENISEHNKSQTEALLNLSLGEELSRRKLSTPNTSFRWAEVNPGIPPAQDRDYSRYKVSAGQSSSPSPSPTGICLSTGTFHMHQRMLPGSYENLQPEQGKGDLQQQLLLPESQGKFGSCCCQGQLWGHRAELPLLQSWHFSHSQLTSLPLSHLGTPSP